ncbi:MAG: hypothetical protein ABJF09_12440 [Qipengyuania citrea]|uniref:hypothetical protein n=1 Tax=Alphaproteobacteria TaxID=28211 RepID=UPI001E517A0C|nr:hypothetical protein [Qipengyuania citrea]MCD1591230.1 hypothetical protein [Qipengyuania citrea]
MNTQTKIETPEYNTGLVEDASADLYVGNVLCEVTESLLNSLRGLIKETNAGPWVDHDIIRIDTMLSEIKEKMRVAKEKIDKSVEDHFEEIRASKA